MGAKGHYIMLDEAFLDDPKIEDLQIAMGVEGVGFYLMLLTVFREYSSTGYRIPYDRLGIISQRRLHLTSAEEERFAEFLEKSFEIGLLHKSEDEEFFWSERRRIDLLKQEEVKRRQSAGGKEAMERRYASKSTY